MIDGPLDFPPPTPGTGTPPSVEPCPLCGTEVPTGADRCTVCDLHLGTDAPGRSRSLPRRAVWGLVGGIAAVWLVTLGVAAVVR